MAAVYTRLLTKAPYLLFIYYIILLVPAGAFKATMSITGSMEIGGNVTITCGWTLADTERMFSFKLGPFPAKPGYQDYYYYSFQTVNAWVGRGNLTNRRMSFDTFNASSNRAIVRITNLQCSDEQNYSCVYTVSRPGQQNVYPEVISLLEVKREAPVVTIEANSLHPTEEYLFVYEQTTITVECAADLGRPGYGKLEWRLYQQGSPLFISNSDPGIQPLERDVSRAGDTNCSDFVKQNFVLRPTTALVDFVVGCFVKNQHNANRTILFCKDTVGDKCALSPRIWTVPPPNVMSFLMGVAMAIVELLAGIALVILVVRLLERWKPAKPARQPSPEEPALERDDTQLSSDLAEEEEEEESFYEEEEDNDV